MFRIGIYLISIMTITHAHRSVQEMLERSTPWPPRDDRPRKVDLKDQEQTLPTTEKVIPVDVHYFNAHDRMLTDSEKSQEEGKALIARRSLRSRSGIDGGGDSGSKALFAKLNSLQVPSTNIPLVETFQEKFLEEKARIDANATKKIDKSQIKLVLGAKTEQDSSGNKEKISEKDTVVIGHMSDKVKNVTANLRQISQSNSSVAESRVDDLKLVTLNHTKNPPTSNSTESTRNTTSEQLEKLTFPTVASKTEEKTARPELKPAKSVPKNNANPKNDTNFLSRFRKQVLNWQARGPPPFNGVAALPQVPPTHSYPPLPLEHQDPVAAYPQKTRDLYSQRPLKVAQPYPAQSFKPVVPEQYNLGLFGRQDPTNNQFYPQGFPPQPSNTSSYFNTPVLNYYYPSVSYQPARLPDVELTTPGYPPLGVPSQNYEVPSYTYGPPSQGYGPPKPTEVLPIVEQKPYRPQRYFRIDLNDQQCVMSREIGAEALIEVAVTFVQTTQPRNCALVFSSTLNVAVSTMVQTDDNDTKADLVTQLNLKMFTVHPTGHVLEVKFPWYLEEDSPGLTLADAGTVIITFQPSASINFRLFIFSYRNTIPRLPGLVTSVIVANATMPLNDTALTEFPGKPNNNSNIQMDFPPQEPELIKIL